MLLGWGALRDVVRFFVSGIDGQMEGLVMLDA